jgi:hypothetical protein
MVGHSKKSRSCRPNTRKQMYRHEDLIPTYSRAQLVAPNCLQNLPRGLVRHLIEGKVLARHPCQEGVARKERTMCMTALVKAKMPTLPSSKSNLLCAGILTLSGV